MCLVSGMVVGSSRALPGASVKPTEQEEKAVLQIGRLAHHRMRIQSRENHGMMGNPGPFTVHPLDPV